MIPLCLSPRQPGGFSSEFPSEGVRSGSFGWSLWCRDPAAVTHHPQKFITSLDELEVPGDLEALALSDRYRMATHLLSYLEEVLRNLAKTLPGPSFTYRSPLDTGEASSCPAPTLGPILHLDHTVTALLPSELSLMIQEQRNGTVTLGQSHARMKLNWTQAAGVGDSGNSRWLEGAPVGEGRKSWDMARREVPNM